MPQLVDGKCAGNARMQRSICFSSKGVCVKDYIERFHVHNLIK